MTTSTLRTADGFLVNGTKVEYTLRRLNRETRQIEKLGLVEGTIVAGDYNVCTFEKSYDVEYVNPIDGKTWTAISVPESKLKIIA